MWSPHRVCLLMNIISLCLKNLALNKMLIGYSSEVLDMERIVLSKNCFKDMLGTKNLYPSLHWQKERTATKTTWGQVWAASQPGPGAGGVAGLGSVLSSKSPRVTHSSRASTKLKLSKGLCSWHEEGAETQPWPWALAREMMQDVIGRHWCVWQRRGQALPWAELLFQVSHHREESGLKCRDTAEYCVCSTWKCSDSTKPDSTTEVTQGAFKDKRGNSQSWNPGKQWKSEPSGFPQAPGYTSNVLHPWLFLVIPKAT